MLDDRSALLAVSRQANVRGAQFNHYVSPREVHPNDPHFWRQWSLENLGQTGGIPGVDIDATEAWVRSRGLTTVFGDTLVVAIIDQGTELDHPDLHFWKNHARSARQWARRRRQRIRG